MIGGGSGFKSRKISQHLFEFKRSFFGSISIIAHTQLDVGYFEAEACFFKRHNKVVFMTAWEWGVKKEKGASPSPLGGYGVFSGWIWLSSAS
jgi:hypothetical protein